jgi:hypothetical protein
VSWAARLVRSERSNWEVPTRRPTPTWQTVTQGLRRSPSTAVVAGVRGPFVGSAGS